MKISEITESLRSFLYCEITEEETAENIRNASPSDLSLAEIEIMSEGYDEDDLRRISDVFLKIVEERKKRYTESLEKTHPIMKFVAAHEKILGKMDEIEKMLSDGPGIKYGQFKYIKNNFEKFGKHHKNEELTILPILKDNGKRGRVNLVKNEHREIKKKKDEIKDALVNEDNETAENKVKELRYLMNKHTVMENNYLYPIALNKIDDWRTIKGELNEMNLKDFRW